MPDCGRRSITRRASSTPNTSRTDERLAPNELASSRSPGRRAPGAPRASSILPSSALTSACLSPVLTPLHPSSHCAPAQRCPATKPLDGHPAGPAKVSIWSDQLSTNTLAPCRPLRPRLDKDVAHASLTELGRRA